MRTRSEWSRPTPPQPCPTPDTLTMLGLRRDFSAIAVLVCRLRKRIRAAQ